MVRSDEQSTTCSDELLEAASELSAKEVLKSSLTTHLL